MSDTQAANVATMPKRATHSPLGQVTRLQDAFDHPDFMVRLKQAVPKHMSPDRMLAVFIQSVQKTPKLREVSIMSLLGAFLSIASVGLEPNTALGHAYLIPFEKRKKEGNKWVTDSVNVQVIFGFQGLMELAYRSGLVRSIHADVVWPDEAQDEKHWECWYGSGGKLLHRPRLGIIRPDGTMPALAYMHANLKGEGESFEVMSIQDVMRVRNATQAYQTALRAKEKAERENWTSMPGTWTEAPWVKHPIPMIRKTVFRAGQKWLPKSIELAAALQLDELQDRRMANFGAVIEGSADVLTTGLDALPDESNDRLDIGLGGDWLGTQRSEPEEASVSQPLDPGRYSQAPTASAAPSQPAAYAPRDATGASRPVDTSTRASGSVAKSVPPEFVHYLIDEEGEVDGDAIRDPGLWAEGYARLWEIARDRGTLAENNEEAIAAARAYPNAAGLLDDLGGNDLAPQGRPEAAAMPLAKTGRGADIAGWVKGAVAAIGTFDPELLDVWQTNNEPTYRAFPPPRRLEIQKALAARRAAFEGEGRAAGQGGGEGNPVTAAAVITTTTAAELSGEPAAPEEEDDVAWSYRVATEAAKVVDEHGMRLLVDRIRERATIVRTRNLSAYQRVDDALVAKSDALRQ